MGEQYTQQDTKGIRDRRLLLAPGPTSVRREEVSRLLKERLGNPVRRGNKLSFITDDFTSHLEAAIGRASDFLYTGFTWRPDETGLRVARALTDQYAFLNGEFRVPGMGTLQISSPLPEAFGMVVLDGLGARPGVLEQFTESGLWVGEFHPWDRLLNFFRRLEQHAHDGAPSLNAVMEELAQTADFADDGQSAGNIMEQWGSLLMRRVLLTRTHSKVLFTLENGVLVAFVGGHNPEDTWEYSHKHWRLKRGTMVPKKLDLSMRLEGPAAWDLLRSFRVYPGEPRTRWYRWGKEQRDIDALIEQLDAFIERVKPIDLGTWEPNALEGDEQWKGGVQIVASRGRLAGRMSELSVMLTTLFDAAEGSIEWYSPYCSVPRDVMPALRQCKERGVPLHLYTNGDIVDKRNAQRVALMSYPTLMDEAGMQIHELGQFLDQSVIDDLLHGMLHTKLLLIRLSPDAAFELGCGEEVAVVQSGNANYRSLGDVEIASVIYDTDAIKTLRMIANRNYKPYAADVTAETMERSLRGLPVSSLSAVPILAAY